MQTAATKSAAAAVDYSSHKREYHSTDRLCEEAGIDYQPIVFESLGAMTDNANQILRALNRRVAETTSTSLSEVATRFWTRMAIDLQRSLHRAFARRVVNPVLSFSERNITRVLNTTQLEEPED